MRVGGKQAVAGEPGDRIYKVKGRDKIRRIKRGGGGGGKHVTTEPM